MAWDQLVPFRNGDQLAYEGWYKDIEWRENYSFRARLTYYDYYHGRSAVNFLFRDEEGHSYSMFLKDFDELFRWGHIQGATIDGTWTFCKRGQNYGITSVEKKAE